MLCSSCRRSLLARLSYAKPTSHLTGIKSRTPIRTVATVPASKNAPPANSPPPPSNTAPAASPTQPFSEPFFPSTTSASPAPATPTNTSTTDKPPNPSSSTPGGTPLSTLSYVKTPTKPLIALEDHEYPSWLWSLAGDPSSTSSGGKSLTDSGLDLSTMSKKTRARHERKQAKLMETMEKPVPLHEQSRDLVGEGAGPREYVEKSRELTKSMRGARRKGIREANFLRSM